MEPNLPATRGQSEADTPVRPALERRQPLSVAFLPLALVTFVTLALIIAAWTFLAAAA